MGIPVSDIDLALITLENDGFVFRGQFTPGLNKGEWCERRHLARIHRYTLQRLRKEIEPVSRADFMRFLFSWHNLESDEKPYGPDALRQVLNQLEGFEAPSASWEGELLPSRIKEYDHNWLDMLCLSGNTVWGRFRQHNVETNGKRSPTPIRSTPITLLNRTNLEICKSFSLASNQRLESLSNEAREVFNFLTENGASFFDEIATKSGLLRTQVEGAIAELVALGLLTSDSFTGLRALLVESKYRTAKRRRSTRHLAFGMEQAGRWSLLRTNHRNDNEKKFDKESLITFAKILLRRYGVVFRRIVDRENISPPWRDLVKIFRILEARGQIRGGRFVEGVGGEQFALPEAVGKLRAMRRRSKNRVLVSISASDPLNLTGVITPGPKVTSIFRNRVLYRDGVPIAIKEGKELKFLSEFGKGERWEIQNALIQRKISPKLRAYLGKGVV